MKSNYVAWSIKLHVKLQVQGLWDVFENGDFEECKVRMALSPGGPSSHVGKEGLDKDNVGDAANNACRCGNCQGRKCADLEE